MIGNYQIADKIGADGFEKHIGFADFLGGGGIFSAIGAFILRGKIRERNNIEGDSCGDFCATFFCLACSECQMANEVGLN